MGQLNIFYHFDVEQDFMYKANTFIQQLNRMSELDAELVHFIHQELNDSSGQIIEKTNEAMEQYQKRNLLSNDLYKNSMNTAARHYTNMINDMRGQHITLYYDVIIREKKR
jgi:Tol biopolymer transport system component